MKWYLSSRTKHKENIIYISKFLESKNQKVLSTWFYFGDEIKDEKKINEITDKFVKEVLESDILMIFNDREGRDIYTELGLALAKNYLDKEIKIYIVGNFETSIMQRHKFVKHFKDLKEVFDFEKIDSKEFIFPDF